MRYELIIYWSKADNSFLVEVPELPGCMADGATYEEAIANAQAAIGEWIETARSIGCPIPEAGPLETAPSMIPAIESEQVLTEEAFGILRQNLPPHKIARLLSMWQIGKGDYVKERDALFAGETVDSLFEQV